jgi:hypothetical protein
MFKFVSVFLKIKAEAENNLQDELSYFNEAHETHSKETKSSAQ